MATAGGPDRVNKAADLAMACPLPEGIELSGARRLRRGRVANSGVDEIEIPAFVRKQAA